MDYEKIIHNLIDSIVEDPASILIRTSEGKNPNDLVILIVAEKNDCARLIAGKSENKHVHLKFESFDEEKSE